MSDLFGEAEPVRNEVRVFSVSEVTRSVRALLEEQIGQVWVEGEISNLRKQGSGHQYFTLKDAASQLSCVLFARQGMWRKSTPLSDGMQVQVRGAMSVYEARGQYQLNVQLVQAGGAGLLQAKFEALKRKLDAEGLFDSAKKKPLPAFPAAIAIVTSATGAALRDMLNVLARRAPSLRVLISPVRVQGEGAGAEIALAIAEANRLSTWNIPAVDLLVLARGGGSVEDLWAFNEEVVARAIAESTLPVVSAVGHEIDFTIADLVADLRAPTPSAAAELVAPDRTELLRRLIEITAHTRRHVLRVLEQFRSRVALLARDELFRQPEAQLRQAAQRVDLASETLIQSWPAWRRIRDLHLAALASRLRHHRPDQLLALRRQQIQAFRERLGDRCREGVRERSQKYARLRELLRVLGPDATLLRGYTVTTTADGEVVTSAAQVSPGAKLTTRVRDGEIYSRVE